MHIIKKLWKRENNLFMKQNWFIHKSLANIDLVTPKFLSIFLLFFNLSEQLKRICFEVSSVLDLGEYVKLNAMLSSMLYLYLLNVVVSWIVNICEKFRQQPPF